MGLTMYLLLVCDVSFCEDCDVSLPTNEPDFFSIYDVDDDDELNFELVSASCSRRSFGTSMSAITIDVHSSNMPAKNT